MYWFSKFRNFLNKPWGDKVSSVRFRSRRLSKWVRTFIPIPVRLPYGGWWLAGNDVCSDEICAGNFEKGEQCYIERSLKQGMTVLDIGAHHGFYTLLAARKVGSSGLVIAFEPSPREQRKLLLHLKINRCKNVRMESIALASKDGQSMFYVIEGRETGCNSLRPPSVGDPSKAINVITTTLDSYLTRNNIARADFIKIDAEGAELEILKGAVKLLETTPRPIIVCEVDDNRTAPWGYSSQEIIAFLENHNYQWYGLGSIGELVPLEQHQSYNLVAIPRE